MDRTLRVFNDSFKILCLHLNVLKQMSSNDVRQLQLNEMDTAHL